jgi:DNA-binding PadR family transcriptional regulator
LQDRKSFRERYLKPALAEGLIEMTLSGKPNSRLQKYRLTDQGRRWLQPRGVE